MTWTWHPASVRTRHGRSSSARRLACVLAGLLVLFAVLQASAGPARAETSATRSPLLEAAFLYRFAGFVEWPDSVDHAPGPFRVGVLDDDVLGDALEAVFAEPDADGTVYEVVRATKPSALRQCRIVFLGALDGVRLREALALLADHPVLIVGHQPAFATAGGHVNFFVEDERLRFEVNLESVEASGLRMSSRLLALARIVESGTGH